MISCHYHLKILYRVHTVDDWSAQVIKHSSGLGTFDNAFKSARVNASESYVKLRYSIVLKVVYKNVLNGNVKVFWMDWHTKSVWMCWEFTSFLIYYETHKSPSRPNRQHTYSISEWLIKQAAQESQPEQLVGSWIWESPIEEQGSRSVHGRNQGSGLRAAGGRWSGAGFTRDNPHRPRLSLPKSHSSRGTWDLSPSRIKST
jgi:hypothetical protein